LPTSQLGQLLQIAASWFQAALGMSVSFVDTSASLPHFKLKWLKLLKMLHNFLSHCKGSFSLEDYQIPPIQHDAGDRGYIMDTVLASKLFTPAQIRRINFLVQELKVGPIDDSRPEYTQVKGVLFVEGRGNSGSWCRHGGLSLV
jgi:hypothetical protein